MAEQKGQDIRAGNLRFQKDPRTPVLSIFIVVGSVVLFAEPQSAFALGREIGAGFVGGVVGLIFATTIALFLKPLVWGVLVKTEAEWSWKSRLWTAVVEILLAPISTLLSVVIALFGFNLLIGFLFPPTTGARTPDIVFLVLLAFWAALLQTMLAMTPNSSLVRQGQSSSGEVFPRRKTFFLTAILSGIGPLTFFVVILALSSDLLITQIKRIPDDRRVAFKRQQWAEEAARHPIVEAVNRGDPKRVKECLDRGDDPNAVNEHGYPILVWAVYFGRVETVKMLLESGADPNATDPFGTTALHRAAGPGNVQIVEMLLEHGVKVNVANNDGVTPLMWAAQGGHGEIVELLLRSGADTQAKDKYGGTALRHAREKQQQSTIEMLRKHEAVE